MNIMLQPALERFTRGMIGPDTHLRWAATQSRAVWTRGRPLHPLSRPARRDRRCPTSPLRGTPPVRVSARYSMVRAEICLLSSIARGCALRRPSGCITVQTAVSSTLDAAAAIAGHSTHLHRAYGKQGRAHACHMHARLQPARPIAPPRHRRPCKPCQKKNENALKKNEPGILCGSAQPDTVFAFSVSSPVQTVVITQLSNNLRSLFGQPLRNG
jgi:hypothetical protein